MNRQKLTALTVAFVSTVALAAPIANVWASFNGFYPGMSKSAAKAGGYGSCRQGAGISERSDSIYCEIPREKRTLGQLTAQRAELEFRGRDLNTVGEIHLTFEAKIEAVRTELSAKYGQPLNGGDYDVWHRNSSETVRLFRSRQTFNKTAYVTFEFDKSVGAARQQQQRDEAKKKQVLKSF